MISIVIGDDHEVVIQGLTAILSRKESEVRIDGTAADGKELVALVERVKPDVAVVDIGMPEMNGLEATRMIRDKAPKTHVMILSMHDSSGFVEEAIRAGAAGYVLKTDPMDEILTGIHQVNKGMDFFSTSVKSVAEEVKNRGTSGSGRLGLTQRELEVLQLIGKGLQYKEIASDLFISLHTVHVHIKNLKGKLHIDSKADLVRFAIKEGLTKL